MDSGLSLDYVTTVLAALLVGTGFVLQQRAAAMEPASRFLSIRLMIDLFRKPRWLAGIGLLVGGYILAAWSIGHLELSLVEPLLTTYLIFALVLAVPLSGHAFRRREVIGAVILVTGVALLSASRSAKPIGLSFGSVSHWPAAAGIAALAVILVEAGRRRSGRLRAALTGTAAGLVLGIQDALTRQTLEVLQGNSFTVLFPTWPAYALVGAGALGIWLTQNAFSAGPLQASLPAISAGEPLIGILLGVIIFGDRIQKSQGLLAIQAGGVAALVVGVVMVASDPALSQLREQASKLRSAIRDTASHAPLRSQPGRSGADAAVGGSPGDAISSGASLEGAPGNPAQGGVVPGGLPDGDIQGGTAPGGVNSRTAPGGVNSSAMPGAANSSTALDGAKEGPIPGQQVAGDREQCGDDCGLARLGCGRPHGRTPGRVVAAAGAHGQRHQHGKQLPHTG